MGQMVLLQHDLPDASRHFDWLIESDAEAPADPDARCLISFRLDLRLDRLAAPAEFEAERIPDHRRLYLTYEGVVNNRGRVLRLASGTARCHQTNSHITITGSLGDAYGTFQGTPAENAHWRFTFHPEEGPHERAAPC